MEIKELSLLTEEEYYKHKMLFDDLDDCWWLKPRPGDNILLYYINQYGEFASCLSRACIRDYGIRPTIRVSFNFADAEYWRTAESFIGQKFRYQDITWTVLSFDDVNKELIALCDEFLDYLPMDTTFTGWNTSELKDWLDTVAFKKLA